MLMSQKIWNRVVAILNLALLVMTIVVFTPYSSALADQNVDCTASAVGKTDCTINDNQQHVTINQITINRSPNNEQAFFAGVVTGSAGTIAAAAGVHTAISAVSEAGLVSGLSAAGLTSGLAALGGTMVSGIAITAASPVIAAGATVAVGFATYEVWKGYHDHYSQEVEEFSSK
jgi:hypothetical protein